MNGDPYLPDTPYQLPLTGAPGMPGAEPYEPSIPDAPLPYIPDIELDPSLQPPLPYIPDVELPPELLPTSTTPSGLPYIPDTGLAPNLLPTTSLGLPFIPDAGLPPELQPPSLSLPGFEEPEKEPAAGPIEFIVEVAENVVEFAGDVVKTCLDVVWDLGKFVIDHLDIGISYQDGTPTVSGLGATYQFPSTTKSVESTKVYAETTKLVQQGQTTGTEAPSLSAGLVSGLAEFVSGVDPRVLLLGGGAVLWYIYKRK